MRAVEVGLKDRERRRVVEVDVEEELLLRVREALPEFALDGAVAGADVLLQHVAYHLAHIFHLGQFGCAPVVQELGTLEQVGAVHAGCAWVASVVEGARVQPETVNGAAEGVAFRGGEKAAVTEVVFPFLDGVDVFPFLGYAAHFEELVQERKGGGRRADEVRGLAGVVGDDLDGVLQGAELGFGGVVEDWETLGCAEDGAEVVTC